MHVHFLDPYKDTPSPIHSLDARVKVVLILSFILTAALAPDNAWAMYILLFTLALSAELLSNLGIWYFMKRALLAIPFVLAALPLLFTVEGRTILALPFSLSVSAEGLMRFLGIGLKSWLSIQMAILLASTTTFPDILLALRSFRLPRLLVAIIGLMWRYLFVLVDEALRLIRARQSRSGETTNSQYRAGGSVIWRARVTGNMAGSLFLRSLERSDRIYMAMLSRGYDGEVRSLSKSKISASAWAILFIGVFILAIIYLLGILFAF